MDKALIEILGAVVILAGFWGYMQTQFVRKDVAAEQNKRFDEKLDSIASDVKAIRELTVVKSTVNELANRLAEVLPSARIPIRGEGAHKS